MRDNVNPLARYQPVANVAEIMGVSYLWLYNKCKEGKVPHVRMGRDIRIDTVLWNEMLAKQAKESLIGSDASAETEES